MPNPARRAGLHWGDPAALGRAIETDDPPQHLLVGPMALKLVREELSALSAEIDRWETLSMAEGEG